MDVVRRNLEAKMDTAVENDAMNESEEEDVSSESSLTFIRETFQELEEDTDQIRYVLEGLYSEVATDNGALKTKLRHDNDVMVTNIMRMKLLKAAGEDQQSVLEYLTEFLNQLEEWTELRERDEAAEGASVASSKYSHRKFDDPQNFMEQAWNKAGGFNSLLIFLDAVQERLKDDWYEMDTWGSELLEDHPMFGRELWETLNNEAGQGHEEQVAYVADLRSKVKEHMENLRLGKMDEAVEENETAIQDEGTMAADALEPSTTKAPHAEGTMAVDGH